MRKPFLFAFAVLVCVGTTLPPTLHSQVGSIDTKDVVALVKENYSTMKTMRAKFIQRVRSQVTEGDITYQSPNKLKMIYTAPIDQVTYKGRSQTIVCDGSKLYIYLPQQQIVCIQSLSSAKNVTGGVLTPSGAVRLTEEYYFSFYNKSELEPLNHFEGESTYLVNDLRMAYHMVLTPTKRYVGMVGFTRIHLWVDRTGMIIRVRGQSTSQRTVEYVFQKIERNIDVSAKTFRFSNPADVQIIRENLIPKRR